MNYLVMETYPSYCVVLDEAGRFLKAANFGYEIGQTVDRIYELRADARPAFRWRPLMAAAGALAALFILVIALQFFNSMPLPYASVYLKINPEVRIDVSRNNLVVGLEPMNEDGAALLRGYDAAKRNLDIVTDELIDRAIAMGFLADGGGVTIRLDSQDEVWFEDTGVRLRSNLSSYLENRLSVTIVISKFETESEPEVPQSITIPIEGDSGMDGDSEYESQTPHALPIEGDSYDDLIDGESFDDLIDGDSLEPVPPAPPVYDDSLYEDSLYDDDYLDGDSYDD